MDSSATHYSYVMPVELWKEILAYCSHKDLSQLSRLNSTFLQISRDLLYFEIFIGGGDRLRLVLCALRNLDIVRRLKRVFFDPTYTYMDRSDGEEFLNIIKSSILVHLELVGCHGTSTVTIRWIRKLLVRLIQLPQLLSLKLALDFFLTSDLTGALQVEALRDLDASDARLPFIRQPHTLGKSLAALDTLRIRTSAAHWKNLLGYVDLSRMKCLALWDVDQKITDLENQWGRLVIMSAATLRIYRCGLHLISST
ncbi:hypothetical protein DL96DRAFT_882932 [Flagelloscypha sp. PMI_526]|nr:hypothetical protein DL96DRAFT_882932 [Flagelloscypha sp. PMI_526]